MKPMNKYNRLSINIAVIFITAMAMTFIPETWPDLFGDWKCGGGIESVIKGRRIVYTPCDYADWHYHQPMIHWGWRHWLWMLMGISIFATQVISAFSKFEDK